MRPLTPEQEFIYRMRAIAQAVRVKTIGFDIFGEPDGFIGQAAMDLRINRRGGDGVLTKDRARALICEQFEALYGVRFDDYATYIVKTNPDGLRE